MARKPWLELPFAIFSFGFYKVNKFIIGNLYTLYLSVNKKNAKEWRIIGEKSLQKFLSLPVLMTKAPRWNTHAIIGTLGPLSVEKELTINLETIRQSTEAWVGCIYDFPGYRTVLNFTQLTDDPSQTELKISLPKGKYTVGLRYYHPKVNPRFPTVKTDLNLTVPTLVVSPQNNDFYQTLAQKTNLYFCLLHYYIFTLFKFRDVLPTAFVKGEFLPVGATDTQFFYGALDAAERLEITIPESWLQTFDFYLTFYNRASFPLRWQKITENLTCDPLREQGYYLIRMRPRTAEAEAQLPSVVGEEIQVMPHQKKLVIRSL
ncbi:hypothetical protein AWQ21_13205 [Picosynechococcus sp. PCC 7003]|uniref:DUF6208 family protein n=1 Tax=Picosynechococcus sp. PCC 7003 TaxID=374981 RepID=UPI0008104941|nr:DUF6208 family protein [Picosynechococcus sp. PCC 7003]ANV85245.1 hypothetical protein AWQ21_13205 [Picosynechococcus sp. PCC 7003]